MDMDIGIDIGMDGEAWVGEEGHLSCSLSMINMRCFRTSTVLFRRVTSPNYYSLLRVQ